MRAIMQNFSFSPFFLGGNVACYIITILLNAILHVEMPKVSY